MKKIFNILILTLFTLMLTFNVFASNNWVNLKLKYDGKTINYSAGKIHITFD